MRKKNIKQIKCFFAATIIFIFACSYATASSLKESVCIVKGNLSPASVAFLEEYRDEIKQKGYSSYAARIDAYLKGTFGSGFACRGSDGKAYIITNHHVVNNADSVNISFEKDDGSFEEYKELKILAISENLDIAIIELPSNITPPLLNLSTLALSDGMDVWSAGYPGLGGQPMWQLGKGIITNSKAKIKELVDPSITHIIQHSAEIDGGNSGGPLLVSDKSAPSKYAVVGINTWKAIYRQNTNFSIPSAAVKKFMDEAVKASSAQKNIDTRVEEFKAILENKENSYLSLTKLVSNQMLSKKAGEIFITVLQKAPTDVRSQITNSFISDPLEGLKYSICYDIWNKFHDGEDFKDFTYETEEISSNERKIVFKIGEDEYATTWTYEQNRWCFYDIAKKVQDEEKDGDKAKKDKKNSKKSNSTVVFDDPFLFEITGGVALPVKSFKPGIDTSLLLTPGNYFSFGLFFHREKDANVDSNSFLKDYYTGFGFCAGGKLPLEIGNFVIEPKIETRVGFMNLFRTRGAPICFSVSGGVNFVFIVIDELGLVVGTNYYHTFFQGESFGDLNITAGVRFLTN